MPTKRTSIRRGLTPSISQVAYEIDLSDLSDGLFPLPPNCEAERMRRRYFPNDDEPRLTWADAREIILKAWIARFPGTRPAAWWAEATEPRRRLGGIGDPSHEHLGAIQERYDHGIPAQFLSAFQADYYNGRARDIHGNLIKNDYRDGAFAGKGIDPKNSPRYESQASYLDRLGLLSAAERRRLKPADFEPELVTEETES